MESQEHVCLEASRDNIVGPMHQLQPVRFVCSREQSAFHSLTLPSSSICWVLLLVVWCVFFVCRGQVPCAVLPSCPPSSHWACAPQYHLWTDAELSHSLDILPSYVALFRAHPHSIISGQTPRTTRQQIHVEDIDFNFKILHAAWHPQRNILALAATNNLYLYHR